MSAAGGIARECVEAYLYATPPLEVLIFRRPPARGSIWVPISGKVEPTDRDLESAVRRELAEETGLRDVQRLFPLDWHVPFRADNGESWRLHAYAVEVGRAFVPVLSPEHDAFEWVNPVEAVRRLHYEDNRAAVARIVARVGGPRSEDAGPRAPADAPDPASPPERVGGPGSEGAPARVFPTLGPELFSAVRSSRAHRVVLQVPAGLVRNAHDLAARLREETGIPVTLATRPCFGACDFPSRDEARADVAVVLGHAPIPNVALVRPTYFVEMREPGGDPEGLAGTVAAAGVPRRLGLVFSVQHMDLLAPLRAALARRGYDPKVGSGDRRLAYPGQALGCNYTGAEAVEEAVDAFLFVGTGRFHPVGLAFAVDRPVWSLDPLQNVLEPAIDRASLIRRRQLLVASVREARRWGILASTFAGQSRMPMALSLQERARATGREAEILVFDRLDPRDLEGRALDAYVNTACPRIALDDGPNYPRPVLTPPEFLMAIGERPLEPYRFDTYH